MSYLSIGIISALVLAIFCLAVALALVIQHYQNIITDLMDRLMARDFSDYQVGSRIGKKTPLKSWKVSDEQAAAKEGDKINLQTMKAGTHNGV